MVVLGGGSPGSGLDVEVSVQLINELLGKMLWGGRLGVAIAEYIEVVAFDLQLGFSWSRAWV